MLEIMAKDTIDLYDDLKRCPVPHTYGALGATLGAYPSNDDKRIKNDVYYIQNLHKKIYYDPNYIDFRRRIYPPFFYPDFFIFMKNLWKKNHKGSRFNCYAYCYRFINDNTYPSIFKTNLTHNHMEWEKRYFDNRYYLKEPTFYLYNFNYDRKEFEIYHTYSRSYTTNSMNVILKDLNDCFNYRIMIGCVVFAHLTYKKSLKKIDFYNVFTGYNKDTFYEDHDALNVNSFITDAIHMSPSDIDQKYIDLYHLDLKHKNIDMANIYTDIAFIDWL